MIKTLTILLVTCLVIQIHLPTESFAQSDDLCTPAWNSRVESVFQIGNVIYFRDGEFFWRFYTGSEEFHRQPRHFSELFRAFTSTSQTQILTGFGIQCSADEANNFCQQDVAQQINNLSFVIYQISHSEDKYQLFMMDTPYTVRELTSEEAQNLNLPFNIPINDTISGSIWPIATQQEPPVTYLASLLTSNKTLLMFNVLDGRVVNDEVVGGQLYWTQLDQPEWWTRWETTSNRQMFASDSLQPGVTHLISLFQLNSTIYGLDNQKQLHRIEINGTSFTAPPIEADFVSMFCFNWRPQATGATETPDVESTLPTTESSIVGGFPDFDYILVLVGVVLFFLVLASVVFVYIVYKQKKSTKKVEEKEDNLKDDELKHENLKDDSGGFKSRTELLKSFLEENPKHDDKKERVKKLENI